MTTVKLSDAMRERPDLPPLVALARALARNDDFDPGCRLGRLPTLIAPNVSHAPNAPVVESEEEYGHDCL